MEQRKKQQYIIQYREIYRDILCIYRIARFSTLFVFIQKVDLSEVQTLPESEVLDFTHNSERSFSTMVLSTYPATILPNKGD